MEGKTKGKEKNKQVKLKEGDGQRARVDLYFERANKIEENTTENESNLNRYVHISTIQFCKRRSTLNLKLERRGK